MTPQELEIELRIEQRILISKNQTLMELIDRHNERLTIIRRELLSIQREQVQTEQPQGEAQP